MRRQLANLRRYGRIRTNRPTPRRRKPEILRRRPHLEITNLLEFVVSHYGKRGKDFFFVQIGAFDGVTADPIHDLVISRGWGGVLVEPQAEAFDVLKKTYAGREGLKFYNVAIGTRDGAATLFTRPGGLSQTASLDKQLLVKPGRKLSARCVPCWTLDTLLKHAEAPPHIDLLQIDAEGRDYAIIRSIDFRSIKPSIIRFEHMVLSAWDYNSCLELLAAQGYRFLLEDGDTTAYLMPRQNEAAP